MMKKDFLKQCDCPEIQNLWGQKLGDVYHCPAMSAIAMLTDKETFELSLSLVGMNGRVWLPRIEDVLGWLGDRFYTLELMDSIGTWRVQFWQGENPRSLHGAPAGATSIEALLNAFMYLRHGKTWLRTGIGWEDV